MATPPSTDPLAGRRPPRNGSARCQRLLRIIAFDDRPDYAGIARDLDMPVGSIGPTRGRCLAKLKELLAANSGKEDK
jgi:hypothetical protein